MFGGLLHKEYGLSDGDVDLFWRENDRYLVDFLFDSDRNILSPKEIGIKRLGRMCVWIEEYCETVQPGECS